MVKNIVNEVNSSKEDQLDTISTVGTKDNTKKGEIPMDIKQDIYIEVNLVRINNKNKGNKMTQTITIKNELINIGTLIDIYTKATLLEDMWMDRLEIKKYIGNFINHDNTTYEKIGEEYMHAFGYSAYDYYDEEDDNFFYQFCNHTEIHKHITEDSEDLGFHKYVDYEKIGKHLHTDEGNWGEVFFRINNTDSIEFSNYNPFLERPEDYPKGYYDDWKEISEICYKEVQVGIDQGYDLATAAEMALNTLHKEVA